ncbi:MAG: hypothetical protein CSA72_10440 [Rhodobacterales bacterium]|nr:MAG: hypothetical protein CSA72_10440 [Rhodobacterales bacterium]
MNDLTRRAQDLIDNPILLILCPEIRAVTRDLLAENAHKTNMLDRQGTGPAERYWEGRWRDEAAENDQLRAAIQKIHDAAQKRLSNTAKLSAEFAPVAVLFPDSIAELVAEATFELFRDLARDALAAMGGTE